MEETKGPSELAEEDEFQRMRELGDFMIWKPETEVIN